MDNKFRFHSLLFLIVVLLQGLSACIPLGPFTLRLPPSSQDSGPSESNIWDTIISQQPARSQPEEEQELYRLLNAYRAEKRLPAIPYSSKLARTARTHSQDLMEYRPDKKSASDGTPCNLHSWSNHGSWTPVCYTPDHREAAKIWSKPREVAGYSGDGFEISAYSNGCQSAECFLKQWKGSPGHNALMVNTGEWADTKWKAVGVGIYGDFANIWFGEVSD